MSQKERIVPPPPEWVGEFRRQPWGHLDRYDRASPAVDCVLFTFTDRQVQVMAHRRKIDPQEGQWALPGVFVNYGESFVAAANRALKEKLGLKIAVPLHEVGVDNQPYRDERGWVITVTLVGLFPATKLDVQLKKRVLDVAFCPIMAPPGNDIADEVRVELPDDTQSHLALGHDRLVGVALEWLRHQVHGGDLVLDLMPDVFTLRELQVLFEAILGESVNKDSFRRSVTKSRALVEPTGSHRLILGRQAAELYRRSSPESPEYPR